MGGFLLVLGILIWETLNGGQSGSHCFCLCVFTPNHFGSTVWPSTAVSKVGSSEHGRVWAGQIFCVQSVAFGLAISLFPHKKSTGVRLDFPPTLYIKGCFHCWLECVGLQVNLGFIMSSLGIDNSLISCIRFMYSFLSAE